MAVIIDAAALNYPRIREVYDGLEWRITRQPEAGALIGTYDPPRRVVHSKEWPGFPGSLVLTYQYTDTDVEVIGARIEPPASSKIPSIRSA